MRLVRVCLLSVLYDVRARVKGRTIEKQAIMLYAEFARLICTIYTFYVLYAIGGTE